MKLRGLVLKENFDIHQLGAQCNEELTRLIE
ncbi:MAG: hypothetical protein ACJA1L_001824 [Paracoccaceae bacterium]